MFKIGRLIGLLLVCTHIFGFQVVDRGHCIELTTLYGHTSIHEPVLVELIKSPTMERLKNIRQYGVTCFAHEEKEYTRYEHSLGVLHILRMYGASLEEQIDGLLHDASHTVFSHVADSLFNHRNKKTSYQDEIHEWFLQEMGTMDILRAHGFGDACCADAKKRHRCLEQDKPDLCADRIEYNLNGGYLDGLLTAEEVRTILEHLHFENDQWVFDCSTCARKFADVALELSRTRWGAPWNLFVDHCASQALKRALECGIINKNMIHFSDDQTVWNLLCSCNDAQVRNWLATLRACEKAYIVHRPDDPRHVFLWIVGKCSGVDPLVQTDTGLCRLSAIDAEYAQKFASIKEDIGQGYCFRFV
jgi:HD superfamily phosphohydrolase